MIRVENLTKKFNGFIAVDNISFEVKKGEFFGLLGPNGAGKTTVIKILTTLLKPSGGSAFLNSYNVVTEPDKARRSFGIVFQDPSLDEKLTALENMEFHAVLYGMPKKIRRERTKELLNLVELWERKNDLVKKFSGGMKRRLEIARGLLHRPKVLFLDEPTLGLDPQTRSHIWSYIGKLNKTEEITIFFTTHYIEEVEKIATKTAIIDEGKIISEGVPEKIRKATESSTLEEAFIKMTGHGLREGEVSSADRMRIHKRVFKH